jgi:beta-lactamase regulating signal transducer with metallopeptidase domain
MSEPLGMLGSVLPGTAESARLVAQLYVIALVATVPLALAALASFALQQAPAATRALVWRSAIAALVIVYVGHWLPTQFMAGVVPSALASPLVSLGRLQVATTESAALARGLTVVYFAGVALVLLPLLRAFSAARSTARRARPLDDPAFHTLLEDVRHSLGLRRAVRLLIADDCTVPATWGVIRPVILLPANALAWSQTHRRAVLLHELAHIAHGDTLFSVVGRIACALFWFHPAAWWIARRLRQESEFACDDRVLIAGVRASDYADVLTSTVFAAQSARLPAMAVALARRGDLRARLAQIVDGTRVLRAPPRWAVALAVAITALVTGPIGSVRFVPTRDVLRTLMTDSRWESRAYAVIGLAQRADSVEVARAAAEQDPNPHVRAWARYALEQPRAIHALPATLPERTLPATERR